MNIVSNTIYFFGFRFGTVHEVLFALSVLGAVLIVFIIFSIVVYFSVKKDEKVDKNRDILKNKFGISFVKEHYRILDINELSSKIGLKINFTKSKLLGLGEELSWVVTGSLIGDFKKTGNIIHYLFITDVDKNCYEYPETATSQGITFFKKSVVIQKLDKKIENFYLYNKVPDKKRSEDNFNLVEYLKIVFKINPENAIDDMHPEILDKILNYYKEFWGVSFEVFNGYLIILTNYPNLDSQGNIDLAVEKYDNFFQKSIDLKKTIEKYY